MGIPSRRTLSNTFEGLGVSLLPRTNLPLVPYRLMLVLFLCTQSPFVLWKEKFDKPKQRVLKNKISKARDNATSPEALSAFSATVLGAVSKCITTLLTFPAIRYKKGPSSRSSLGSLLFRDFESHKLVSFA